MDHEQRIRLLQATPFFGAATDASITLLLELSKSEQLASGEYFFHQGERGDALYLLEQGQVVIFRQWHNTEYPLRYVKNGGCFGELALIDLAPRDASARAEMDCRAIRIPASALHALYQQDPEQFLIIQMNMAREVSRRLRDANERWFLNQVGSSQLKIP